MKVLHITKENGYVQKQLIKHEKMIGADAFVFSYVISFGAKKNADCDELYVSPIKFKGPFFAFPRLRVVSRYLKRRVPEIGADILHAHFMSLDGVIARDIHREYGIPYVVTVRNTDLYLWGLWDFIWNRRTMIDIIQNASAIVFLSETYKKHLNDKVGNRLSLADKQIQIIPNGIDEYWKKHSYRRERFSKEKSIQILTVGDVCKNKNQLMVAAAVDELKRKGFNIRYVIAGKNCDDRLLKKLEEQGVQYLGVKGKEELLEVYRSSDIFIMPSYKESFGLVYAEAMTQSLPLIYSRGQGFDGQFSDGEVGYCVDPFSLDEIVAALQKVIENYDALSENAYKNRELFSWETAAYKMNKLYESILNNKNA